MAVISSSRRRSTSGEREDTRGFVMRSFSSSPQAVGCVVIIGCGLFGGGCGDRSPRAEAPPVEAKREPEAAGASSPLASSVAEGDGELRLEMTIRLEAAFARAFPGTAEEAAAGLRKEAFPKADPGSAVVLHVNDEKRVLDGRFVGSESFRHQASVVEALLRSGSWTMPGREARVDPKFDPVTKAAAEKSASWRHALLQLGNKAARDAALEEIAAALAGNDPAAKVAALEVLHTANQIEFDRAKFRQLVLPLLGDAAPKVRAGAIGALLVVSPDPEDLGRVLAMVDDGTPEVRRALPYVIKQLAKGDLTGVASGPIMKLIDELPPEEARPFLSSLWGSKYSPELEEKLVGLPAASPRITAYDVMYYSLSTQQNKGEKTVDTLIACLSDADQTNVGGRALWGLGYGVNPDQQPKVADAMLNYFTVRATNREDCLRILGTYGGAAHADALAAFGQREGVNGELQKKIDQTVTAIRQREAKR